MFTIVDQMARNTSFSLGLMLEKVKLAANGGNYADWVCRGFVTADVRRLRFEAIAKVVDSKGLIEMRDTSLPTFGPSRWR